MLTGQVDGDPHYREALIQPLADLTAHVLQHVKIKPADVAGLFQRRNEIVGINGLAIMVPAAQGFRAANLPGTDIHLGLVHRVKLLFPQGVRKILLHPGHLLAFMGQLLVIENDLSLFSAHGSHIGRDCRPPYIIHVFQLKVIRDHEYARIGRNRRGLPLLIGDSGFGKESQCFLQPFLPADRHKVVTGGTAHNSFPVHQLFHPRVMVAQHKIGLLPSQFLIH